MWGMGNELLYVCGLGNSNNNRYHWHVAYNAHHSSEIPEHRSVHWGCMQPYRSWRCVVRVLEDLRFSLHLGWRMSECVRSMCVCLFVVLYCYFTCREIINREQALSPPVS